MGSHVVKAQHLFAGAGRPTPAGRTVAVCGEDAAALDLAAGSVRDLGGEPAVVGGLGLARQLEGVAGVVMRLVAAGHDPVTAVPAVDPSRDRG